MNVNINNAAAENIFKNQRPQRVVCCPVHKKTACVKYVQPPRPQSCKPMFLYYKPEHSLEGATVYHMSYRGVGPDTARACRPSPITSKNNFTLSDAPLEGQSMTTLSYQWTWEPPAEPYRPLSMYQPPEGPIQHMTTQRHDFPPKPSLRSEKIVPRQNLSPIKAKMEDKTVMMQSYLPVWNPEPPHSSKPVIKYNSPQCPVESTTTTQLSFKPPEMSPRDTPPWMVRRQYQPQEGQVVGDTVYSCSFLPPGTFQPCEPEPQSQSAAQTCLCHYVTATEDL